MPYPDNLKKNPVKITTSPVKTRREAPLHYAEVGNISKGNPWQKIVHSKSD